MLTHVIVQRLADHPGERGVVGEPRHRREDEDRERRMIGGRRRLLAGVREGGERFPEAVTGRDVIRLGVVEQLVAAQAAAR